MGITDEQDDDELADGAAADAITAAITDGIPDEIRDAPEGDDSDDSEPPAADEVFDRR